MGALTLTIAPGQEHFDCDRDAMVQVRRANIGDIAAMLSLVADYWQMEGIGPYDSQRVEAALAQLLSTPALGAGWIAIADGQAVGYLLGVYVFSLEHLGLTAEIDEFFVSPGHRGRGIGAAILVAAEREFATRGCTNASLQLGRENQSARAFYHARGYAERSGFELLEKPLSTA